MEDNVQFQRILGIDYGTRRLGIAISDPLKITAQQMPTIKVQGLKQVLTELDQIIRSKNVAEIVVGLPLNLKGEKSASAQAVEKFVEQLKSQFKIPVHTWDERWTSITAQQTIRDLGKSPSRHKDKIDQISALLILQGYLDFLSVQAPKEMEPQ